MRLIDLYLPTYDEVKDLSVDIRKCEFRYWLRDASELPGYVKYVDADGSLHNLGCNVRTARTYARPFAKISGVADEDIGKEVMFGGVPFIVIDKQTAFAKTALTRTVFNNEWDQAGSNRYEGSVVKEALQGFLKEMSKETPA